MLLTACGHRPSDPAPAPCVCPAIPDALLTCPEGAARPDPIDMVTLTIALAEERAAGDVCRARMGEIRSLENRASEAR
ncbi:hypothetical protein [Roseospira visakhapatnamensis]|uniref:Uncharacterized protein n=1 Tax=Roseospira visakhapatnamensis TaxID=390880 RepID=A0A7W6W9X9_9PROT|nr:hypothetical protein [Roseospira visakhapatnamensis]MBB4266283.1 hypothetical protein [Roseospira visakhapatnamensis]